MASPDRVRTRVEPRESPVTELGETAATAPGERVVVVRTIPPVIAASRRHGRHLVRTAASCGQLRRPQGDGRPAPGFERNVNGEGDMVVGGAWRGAGRVSALIEVSVRTTRSFVWNFLRVLVYAVARTEKRAWCIITMAMLNPA